MSGLSDTVLRPALRTFARGSAGELAEAVLDVVIRNRTLRETAREHQVPKSTLQRQSTRFRNALKAAIADGYIEIHELVQTRPEREPSRPPRPPRPARPPRPRTRRGR